MHNTLQFRLASPADEPALQAIRVDAFRPVFSSFRELLGEEIYEVAQKPEDDAQSQMLSSLLSGHGDWQLFVAEIEGAAVGFIALLISRETGVGEIGLNAVAPARCGQGIGTAMYEFALANFRQAGMTVATVATGADRSHLPARRAYRKAGFDVEVPSVWMCRSLK